MSELVNLIVDLHDARWSEEADSQARHAIANLGLRIGTYDERTLAWIDAEFGGGWSREVFLGDAIVAFHGEEPVGFAAFDVRTLTYAWLHGVAREPGVGLFGPVGVASAYRGGNLGKALIALAILALRARGYSRALIAAVSDGSLARYYERTVGARVIERFSRDQILGRKRRAVILASGNGSNAQSVIDAVATGDLALNIVGIVANRTDAYVLERATAASLPTNVQLWNRTDESRDTYDSRLLETVQSLEPEIVLLLGWMHLLSPTFITAFPEVLNIHPAFLPHDATKDTVTMPDGVVIPAFRGAHAVRDAQAASSPWIGASVHRVTAETDRGDVLIRYPLRMADSVRLHVVEHNILLRAIRLSLFAS
ncbi:MAG: GNAT family N-acetyltransferase [Vulcanimicrobiaceae bacterium]